MNPNYNNCLRRVLFPLFISSLVIVIAALFFTSTWAQTTENPPLDEETQQRISSLYKKSLFHYHSSRLIPQDRQENLAKAKDIFKQILVIDPTEKKARVYIDKKIPARQKEFRREAEREVRSRAKKDTLEARKIAREEARLRREAEREVRARARKDKLEARERAREEAILRREAEREVTPRVKKDRLEVRRKVIEEERLRREAKREARARDRDEAILRREEARIKKGTSDFITIIKVKSAREHFEDAKYLYSIGRYEDALSLYNFAYDIAKDELKKEIRAVRRNARRDLAIRERKLKKAQ